MDNSVQFVYIYIHVHLAENIHDYENTAKTQN